MPKNTKTVALTFEEELNAKTMEKTREAVKRKLKKD